MIPWCLHPGSGAGRLEQWGDQGRSLVMRGKLRADHFERIVSPALARFQYWLLDIPVPPHGAGHDSENLCQRGWAVACEQWEQGSSLEVGLTHWLDTLFQGMMGWQVFPKETPVPQEAWRGFSVGLQRWSEAFRISRIWLDPVPRVQGRWCTMTHWAGRVLPGESWVYLEQCPVGPLVTVQANDGFPYQDLILELMERKIWDPARKPGKLWHDAAGWWWLWPLAFRDISRLIDRQSGESSPSSLADWVHTGLIEAPGLIEQRIHPLLSRRVDGVRPAESVQRWLNLWFGMSE